jgi:hypothetical protein
LSTAQHFIKRIHTHRADEQRLDMARYISRTWMPPYSAVAPDFTYHSHSIVPGGFEVMS